MNINRLWLKISLRKKSKSKESKSAENQISLCNGGWGGGGGGGFHGDTLPLLKTKFCYAPEGVMGTHFQLLMLSPNLLKTKFPYASGGGGVIGTDF